MGNLRILLVEPDPIRRKGLSACLSEEKGMDIVGSAGSLSDALNSMSKTYSIDILLINVDTPGVSDSKFWVLVRAVVFKARVVALTSGKDIEILKNIFSFGPLSILPPDVEPEVICKAVKMASAGIPFYDGGILDEIKVILLQREETDKDNSLNLPNPLVESIKHMNDRPPHLTPREREIFQLLR